MLYIVVGSFVALQLFSALVESYNFRKILTLHFTVSYNISVHCNININTPNYVSLYIL